MTDRPIIGENPSGPRIGPTSLLGRLAGGPGCGTTIPADNKVVVQNQL